MDWFFSKPVFPNLEFTTGMPTASFTFLDRGKIASVNYYDIRNRVIQTRAQNHAGGYDHYTNEYGGLTQRIAKAEHAHCTTFNLESYDFSEETRFVYDDVGRLVSKEYRFNNSIPKQVITNSYDALGRLKSKQIGDENYLLQTVDYTYNMRGWLTKINNPGEVSLDGDFFGEEIFYDIPDNSLSNIGNSRLFNGNISGIKWQSVRPTGIEGPTTTGLKAYVYDYDNLNRLTLGSYLEVEQGSWVSNAKYTESIGPYDLNGNIKSLRRRGICVVNNSPDYLDYLTYTYNGNQVIAVDDEIAINNTDDFYDNGHYYNQTQETEYRYDGNGNLISDLNKNIIEINYNYQNLPVSFSKRGDNRVEYDYSPQGSKLAQRYLRDGALVKTTDFVANFVYEDGIPAWVIYDEGRVVFDVKGGVFAEAFLKDHLGNVRVAIRRSSGQTTIRQTDSYYPFGMTIRDLSRNGTDVIHKNEYLYNGKMHQDEMGLNLLDYGARFYDPVLGRWHSVDPLAEKYRRWSTYNYCVDNPMKFIDPDGMKLHHFTIDENGQVQFVKWTYDNYNVIFNKKDYDNGKRDFDKSGEKSGIRIDKGEISNEITQKSDRGDNAETVTRTSFEVKTREVANNLHKFLDKNTVIEYSNQNYTSPEGKSFNVITTSYETGPEAKVSGINLLTTWYLNNGNTLNTDDHNHPHNNPEGGPISDGDISYKQQIQSHKNANNQYLAKNAKFRRLWKGNYKLI